MQKIPWYVEERALTPEEKEYFIIRETIGVATKLRQIGDHIHDLEEQIAALKAQQANLFSMEAQEQENRKALAAFVEKSGSRSAAGGVQAHAVFDLSEALDPKRPFGPELEQQIDTMDTLVQDQIKKLRQTVKTMSQKDLLAIQEEVSTLWDERHSRTTQTSDPTKSPKTPIASKKVRDRLDLLRREVRYIKDKLLKPEQEDKGEVTALPEPLPAIRTLVTQLRDRTQKIKKLSQSQ